MTFRETTIQESSIRETTVGIARVAHNKPTVKRIWTSPTMCSKVNKSAQSNLGRGPSRGTVAHVRRKVSIGYSGAPQIRPEKYPFPWTDRQTPLPASSLDPSDLRCQTASGSDPPFFHNALDRPTHRQTDRSCTGKFDHYRPLRPESDVA